jgi:hypothetical protein
MSPESDDDEYASQSASVASSATSLPVGASTAGEQEFKTEVRLSLDRAFSEGHSLGDASIELKTLRMVSNVPLRRVREAVVAGIVEMIPLVEGAVPQRVEIKKWVDRWGELINLIGGVDGVETVSILQVNPHLSSTTPLIVVCLDSTIAHPPPGFTCLAKYLRHFIKMILWKKSTFVVGTLNQKPKARALRLAPY